MRDINIKMPSIQIKTTNAKKVPSPLPTAKNIIKYKDLLEGIGHQVITKIMLPINYGYSVGLPGKGSSNLHHTLPHTQHAHAHAHAHSHAFRSENHAHAQASPGLKQLTGAITLLYIVIICIICLGMGLVYLIWPEEHSLLRRMMLTALPFMVCFTLSILLCYIYLNRTSFCLSFNSVKSSMVERVRQQISKGQKGLSPGLRKMTRSNNYDPGQQVSSASSSNHGDHQAVEISGFSRTTSKEEGNNSSSTYGSSNTHSQSSFERSFDDNLYRYQNEGYVAGQYNRDIVNVPMWKEPDYTALEDDQANSYKNVGRPMDPRSLEFLKYKD